MNIQAQAMKALDVLESSEVLHEFDDSVTLRVERDLWEAFIGGHEQCDHTFERNDVMINVCTKCGIEGAA